MICEKNVKKFCSGDITKIENYDTAKASPESWHIHHRLEIHEDYQNSRDELKMMNLYYDRPPEELIFLNSRDHLRLHRTGTKQSDITRCRRSISLKGHSVSSETRVKIGAGNRGKIRSESFRKILSDIQRGSVKGARTEFGKLFEEKFGIPCARDKDLYHREYMYFRLHGKMRA